MEFGNKCDMLLWYYNVMKKNSHYKKKYYKNITRIYYNIYKTKYFSN